MSRSAGEADAAAAAVAASAQPERTGRPLPLGAAAGEVLLLAGAGAAQALAYAWPWAWPLQMIAFALLAHRVLRATPRRAFALGQAFGTAWLGAAVWWLFVSMHRYGGLPAWMAALAVLALASVLALWLAGAMWLVARCRPAGVLRAGVLFAAAVLAAELARGVVFTGFPWAAIGYAHVDSPYAGYAAWVGVYGMGALVAFVAGVWGAAPLRQGRAWLLPALALLASLVLGALAALPDFTRGNGTLSVTLLQGNIAQDEKFEQAHIADALALLERQLAAARGDLVVGPETVIPLLPADLDPAWWDALVRPFREGPRAALLGAPQGDATAGYTNSALGLSAAATALPGGRYRYDKHHLVPFGEFIPTGFRWFTAMMNIPLGDFDRGPLVAASFAVRGQRVGPNICYEDLFGEELAARFADADAAPTVLANLSNIGWFGDTSAVPQHLAISRLRTLELGRPMLRATNTGATAIVDHRGVVRAALPPYTRGLLDGEVEGRTGLTPYAAWVSRASLWPLALVAALIIGVAWRRRP